MHSRISDRDKLMPAPLLCFRAASGAAESLDSLSRRPVHQVSTHGNASARGHVRW